MQWISVGLASKNAAIMWHCFAIKLNSRTTELLEEVDRKSPLSLFIMRSHVTKK